MILGRVFANRTVAEYCDENNVNLHIYIHRHEMNDWGDLDEEDKHANNMEMFAVAVHVLSKYMLPTELEIYVETNWNEEERYTPVMFPEDR